MDNGDKRFSGILGEDYDLFNISVPHHDELQNLVKDTLTEFCSSVVDDKILILEAGTGTGITTIRILETDSRINVIAVDNEEKTLKQAEEILSDFKERLTFKHADLLEAIEELPDNHIHAFVSAYTIHNLPPEYRSQLFTEIYRILKLGGIFLNADKYAQENIAEHRKSLEEQIKDFDKFEEMGKPNLKEEWTTHYLEDEKIKITDTEQVEILKNLGFKDIKILYRKRMEAFITARK